MKLVHILELITNNEYIIVLSIMYHTKTNSKNKFLGSKYVFICKSKTKTIQSKQDLISIQGML